MSKSILSHRMSFAAPVCLLLAACAPSAEGDESAEAETDGGESANPSASVSALSVAETGWLTVGQDGAVQTTFFDGDGRYRDLRNGAELAGGQWEQRADGTICFEPDAGLGACWQTGAADDNGTIVATNSDGKSIAIKQVTYAAPSGGESEAVTDAVTAS